ncbi:MAG: PAS domain-containing protein [Leptospirales bacterium]|nr:PAS domain-containing protein [Leptospirales bacterium]
MKRSFLTPWRICVIEDDEGLNHLICRKLEKAGLDAIGIHSGQEVMNFSFTPADLLLMDYDLGGILAGELVDRIKQKFPNQNFAVLTGRGDEKSAVEMMKKGARDYLVKTPEAIELLPAAIGRILQELEKEAMLRNAQERLKQREHQLAQAQKLANVGSFEWYVTLDRLDLSPELYRIMGWPESEPIPKPRQIIKQIHPSDRRTALRETMAIRHENKHISVNFRMTSASGVPGLFRLEAERRITKGPDDSDQFEILGILHDVSQQVAIEHQLLRYQEQLETLVQERTRELILQRDLNEALIQSTPDPLFAFDRNHRINRCNPSMRVLLSLPESDLLGQPVHNIVPELYRNEMEQALNEVLEGRSRTIRAFRLNPADPASRFYDVLISPLHGERNDINGGLVFLHDVTESKAYSESLRRSEERLRTILDTIPVPMAVLRSADSVALFVNPAFQPLLATDVTKILGKPVPLFSDDLDGRLIRHALETEGYLFNYETQIPRPGSSPVWTLLSAQRILLEKEEAWLVSMVDITERKTAEGQLKQALDSLRTTQNQLIHAEKLAFLGGLTAGIAHEIKNPLNFINNFSILSRSLAQDIATIAADPASPGVVEKLPPMTARLKDNLEIITKHGKRIDSIIRNMLMHSRGEPGDFQEIRLNDLVEESVNLAYHGMRASETDFNAKLNLDLDENIGRIQAIPQDLGRVFVNLATNGFQTMSEKRRKLTATEYVPTLAVQTRKNEHDIEIRIRDNGMGISQANMARLFTPFFTTKPAGAGTGLGLSLSYETIVNGHNGKIRVESTEGEFAEFIITLPSKEHQDE